MTTEQSTSYTPFRQNRPLQWMVGTLLLFWLVLAIEPAYREDWLLENIFVVFFSLLLIFTHKHFVFSQQSYLLLSLFMALHLIGAHYTYAETPLGFWMQGWFGFERNHFDRLVHFSFGLLLALPVRELLLRGGGLKHAWCAVITVLLILGMGALFELFEWLAAILVYPELGAAYLGTQGDVWDAQQDMFQATLGAITTLLLTKLLPRS